MSKELCEMIIQLANQGGTVAIWLFGLHIVGSVLRFIIGFGCFAYAVIKFCKTWKEIVNEKS